MWLTSALFLVASVGSPSLAPPGFWDHWGDGKAEIDSYRLVMPRYGELRHGTAVLVYVTETFTQAQRVKSDGGHDDEVLVMKLNEVREFQTGIYDYDVLTSSFAVLDGSLPLGVPTKVSLSVQEWCGHVYEQLLFWPDRFERTAHSYFDGEGDRTDRVLVPEGAVSADALPIWVRGVAGELVAPGQKKEVQLLDRAIDARFAHRRAEFQKATITRSSSPQKVETPAGTFDATAFDVVVAGVTTTYFVEVPHPRRLVGWTKSDGEEAWLVGSARTVYWQQNHEGDERLLEPLGLHPVR